MLGQPVSMLLPEVIGFRLTGKLQGRRHRHRPRAHRHADAAQEGRGRQVRRVLRPRPLQHDARRPRHDRQHGAGIWRDLRLLPGRCRDDPLPHHVRPLRKPHRAGRGLFQGAGHVARHGLGRSGLHRPAANSISATSCRRWPGRSGPKAASRWKASPPASPRRWRPNTRRPSTLDKRYAVEGDRLRSRPWRRGDRRDHLLHQHLEPERADRRRPARPQRQPPRPEAEALGQDLARAGQPGRRRISRQVRPAEGARPDRLQPRRLRLHHLHRQFRPAAGADLQDHQRQGPDRRRRALRQPQFRRPRLARRAGELSGLAAAGRRLCAGRHGAPRT